MIDLSFRFLASFRFIAAIAIAAALLTGCSEFPGWVQARVGPGEAKVKPEGDRKLAPDFALKDATGKTVKLSDYRGKVVVLNFWATWCGPCSVEIPWFKEFQQTYKDRDFAVIGISEDDDGWQSVKPYIEHSKINYRIAIGTEEISQQYGGIDSLPTTFVIDRQGRIAAVHVGLIGKSEYQNEIVRLLKTNVT